MYWMRAVIIAFSTYSRIPMPRVKWDDEAMQSAIAFLPLVGFAIGGLIGVWQWVCLRWQLEAILFAAVAVDLPILITGGIHLDGYCDTIDALASRQNQQRCLEIMKDPHVGAFATIHLSLYILLRFALLHGLFLQGAAAGICFVYGLSRCLAAWSAITMPGARSDGMLAAFTGHTHRPGTGVWLALFALISMAGLLWIALPHGIVALILCLPVTLWYRHMTRKRLGGVTGDTTGFYLQTIELALLTGLLFGSVVSTAKS